MNANEQKIVKMAQLMLLEIPDRTSIIPVIIQEHIDQITTMRRVRQLDWGQDIDCSVVIDELIRRFSQWIGKDSTLQNEVGHIPWLTAARKQNWIYWLRYREWLEFKLSPVAGYALDQSTDWILSLLEDPQRDGRWDQRGLVVGHVQSGKTSHYTGLIIVFPDINGLLDSPPWLRGCSTKQPGGSGCRLLRLKDYMTLENFSVNYGIILISAKF